MTLYIGDKPVGLYKVVEKKVPKTKFGVSVDAWIGDVDENGVLNKTTWTGALDFAGVKQIPHYALAYMFYSRSNLTGVYFSSLQSVSSQGLYYAFHSCTGLTSLDFSSLQSVDNSGMFYAFYGCSGLTNVDLSSLQSIEMSGLYYVFYNCSNLTSVDLSSLQSVAYYGLYAAFSGCKKLTTISFPSLTSVVSASFGASTYGYAFKDCTALTEIHFRADMQATIEAMTGYDTKWGATNATIYFDL